MTRLSHDFLEAEYHKHLAEIEGLRDEVQARKDILKEWAKTWMPFQSGGEFHDECVKRTGMGLGESIPLHIPVLVRSLLEEVKRLEELVEAAIRRECALIGLGSVITQRLLRAVKEVLCGRHGRLSCRSDDDG